jgi:two-component system chemotaxis sensor kinase CheA
LDTSPLKAEMKAKAESKPRPEEPAAPGKDAGAKRAQQEAAETLRVRLDLLTRLMTTAGELVLARNQLFRALEGHVENISGLAAMVQNLDRVTTELQEGVMQTRMQPVGTLFSRFSRVVRDMARDLGKEIELSVEGSEVELDKSIIELLTDPLTHLVRNCADHAIEPPEERSRLGKRRAGRIVLRAYHEGGQVNISVSDDGRGINLEKVLQKAVERGLVQKAEAATMSDRDTLDLIFAPGFSTAEVVSDVSGRGVGMDVVRTNIERLGGHIAIETAPNEGTTVLLRLPLTLAIIPSLIVGVSGHRFAVPQVNLVELVWIRAGDVAQRVERVHEAPVLRLRGRLLPLVHLGDVLDIERIYFHPESGERQPDRRMNIADRRSPDDRKAGASEEDEGGARPAEAAAARGPERRQHWHSDFNILVLRVGAQQFGVMVDELLDTEEIVVKPLSSFIKQCRGFAGATILGDGRVIMILDAGGVANLANLHFTDVETEEKRRQEEESRRAAAADTSRQSIILFNNAPDEFFAVSQDKVLRLELIRQSEIQRVGDKEFIHYRGSGLPLVRLEHHLPVRRLPEEAGELFLIIPKSPRRDGVIEGRAGIVASRIVDALDVDIQVKHNGLSGPGLLGSAMVQNHLTLFLDPPALLEAAGMTGGEPA